MSRRPSYPFPLPNLPPEVPPFPEEVPWETPVVDLLGFWLEVYCGPCRKTVQMPFRLLAATHGWKVTLRETVERLKCSQCGSRPVTIKLVESAEAGPGRWRAKEPRTLVVSGSVGG